MTESGGCAKVSADLRVSDLECHEVGPDDWSRVRAARTGALADSPDSFLGTLKEASTLDETAWRETFTDGAWYLAESAGQVVGLARAVVLEQLPGERYIESVWVAPGVRGAGVARLMIRAIAADAFGQGAIRLRLAVLAGNDAGRAAFVSMGFEPQGRRPEDPEEDLVLPASLLRPSPGLP